MKVTKTGCVVLFAITCAAATASAQTPGAAGTTSACAAGMTAGPDTQGHCCWPGQAWSTTRSTCVGSPLCPAGYTAQGEACVAVVPANATGASGVSACPAGQSVGPDTAGHCCWGGQAWSTSRNTCVGSPLCPAGYTAQGDACVAVPTAAAPSAAAPSATVTARSDQVVVGPWGIPRRVYPGMRLNYRGQVPPGFRLEHEERRGVFYGGAIVFFLGYAASIAESIGGVSRCTGTRASLYSSAEFYGFIPLAGSLLYAGSQSDCNSRDVRTALWVYSGVDTLFQLVGGLVGLIGYARRNHDTIVYVGDTHAARERGPQWAVVPGAAGAPVGATFVMTTF